ncbi:MAG: sugar phosphate isomerase/epimerase [Actinobacteria bacterium]|nr:sugar phosphate isomerase/epimerase [Actinomycetota bacterium]
MAQVANVTDIKVALSTASVFPERAPDAFETAARLGYDGIEVMVTTDPVSQDASVLRKLSDYHGIPVVAVHAPNLLITQRVWGRDPWGKLQKSRELADALGARVVVVHPPFIWQRDYARYFQTGIAEMSDPGGVRFAVENLYPLLRGETEIAAYAPHWNPIEMGSAAVTLDVSHAAVSGLDALAMAKQLGDRVAHVHLGDGTKPGLPDEHLVPGRGTQPCGELLKWLTRTGFKGYVVLEVSTHRVPTLADRQADLAESLQFARQHLASGPAWAARD